MFQNDTRKFFIPIVISTSVFIFGILLKIMHWQLSGVLMLLGVSGIVIFYTLRFFFKREKRIFDYVKFGLVLSYVARVVITLFHLPGKQFISILFFTFIGLFLLGLSFSYFTNFKALMSNVASKNYGALIKSGLMNLGAIFIIVGSILKVSHGPGAGLCLLVGLTIIAVWAVYDLLISKEES